MKCVICNTEFIATSRKQITCSKECSNENKEQIKKEHYLRTKNLNQSYRPRRYNPDYIPLTKKEQRKRYRTKYKEKIKERSRIYNIEKKSTVIKNYNLKKFGITLDDYNRMLRYQSNLCAICKELETTKLNGKIKLLSVDHCHTTGKVRELLCCRCNLSIGRFEESTQLLQNAIDYLKKHKEIT